MITGLLRLVHRKRPVAFDRAAYKPGSVGQSSSGRSFLWGSDHSGPLAAYPRCLERGGATPHRLFGLAPAGVYRATRVTTCAVSSYLTVSPLPDPAVKLAIGGLILCGTFRRLSAPRCYLAACPVEPGLSSAACGCRSSRDRPAAHPQIYSLPRFRGILLLV